MNKAQKLLVGAISSTIILLASGTVAHASGDCIPVYGGGIVCPTPTPSIPQLPSAGVESIILPTLLGTLGGGIYFARKASKK